MIRKRLYMTRRDWWLAAWALSLSVLIVACSGRSAVVTPTAPTPVVTPAAFPAMTGGWSGTRSITLVERGGFNRRDSNTCTETWILTTQTDGRFSGTFQIAGGTTTTCSQSGTVTGEVSTSGTLSALVFTDPPPTGLTVCRRTGGSAEFSGVVANAAAVTAQRVDVQSCTVTAGTLVVTADWDRTTALAMNKR